MKKVELMTLIECREWLTRDTGWSDKIDSSFYRWFRGDRTSPECEYWDFDFDDGLPIKETIDQAVALFPENSKLVMSNRYVSLVNPEDVMEELASVVRTDDLKLDLFRLAVLARYYEQQAKVDAS